MWKNTVESDRLGVTILRIRNACWITKSTNTLSEYVLLFYFPQQQCLHESASVLRNMYTACLLTHCFSIVAWEETME